MRSDSLLVYTCVRAQVHSYQPAMRDDFRNLSAEAVNYFDLTKTCPICKPRRDLKGLQGLDLQPKL